MKVVLDTNIWVSAIIWGGIPDDIILLAEQQQISIAMSVMSLMFLNFVIQMIR